MRSSIIIAAVAVVVIAAGGLYYGLEVYPQRQFRDSLTQAIAALPKGMTATYQNVHYSPLSHQAVVTGLKLHGELPAEPPQPFDISADSVETESPNLDFASSWSSAVANPAAFGPDAAVPVAETVTVTGLSMHSAALNFTEQSARVTRPRVYPWALLHDGMPTWADLQPILAAKSRPPELADLLPILRAEAAVILGLAWDSQDTSGVKVSETLPGTAFEYNVRKMTGGAFDRGVMRGASGEGIAFSGDPIGKLGIDHVTMGAIDIRQPMTRLVNGEPLSPALLDGFSIGQIEYTGIIAQPPGQPAFHIGAIMVGPVSFAQGVPVSGQLGWTDISVSREQIPNPQAQDAFTRLGLNTMTTSFAMAYDWDVARRRASVHDTMLRINELGTLTISVDLSNLTPNAMGLSLAQLVHANLRLDDASLVDRLIRAGAAQAGTGPADFRQQIIATIREQTTNGGNAGPALQAAGQAAVDFVNSPHSLTIELAPPTPVSFVVLAGAQQDPTRMAALLGLTVTASQK